MISCKLCGGLGNQLFQIFTVISYALKYSKSFFFLNNYQLGNGDNGSTIRYTYWKTFLSTLKPFLKNMNEIPELTIVEENSFIYEELPVPDLFEKNGDILLVGYYQSPLYFDKYKDLICKLIKLDFKKAIIRSKVNIDFNNNDIISIHFRLGDYKNNPNLYPILSENYYSNSISYIVEKLKYDNLKQIYILYFCEDNDVKDVKKTIIYLEEQFPLLVFIRANPLLDDWEQMLLMSLCRHNIIANSTFSWWGAYLNNNPEKIVCYPEQWFTPQAEMDTSDLFPRDWISIQCN